MGRVVSVLPGAIKVSIFDVVPNDVLHLKGDESDPIIEKVERRGNQIKYYYKLRSQDDIKNTVWMSEEFGPWVFVHDLKNERFEFNELEET